MVHVLAILYILVCTLFLSSSHCMEKFENDVWLSAFISKQFPDNQLLNRLNNFFYENQRLKSFLRKPNLQQAFNLSSIHLPNFAYGLDHYKARATLCKIALKRKKISQRELVNKLSKNWKVSDLCFNMGQSILFHKNRLLLNAAKYFLSCCHDEKLNIRKIQWIILHLICLGLSEDNNHLADYAVSQHCSQDIINFLYCIGCRSGLEDRYNRARFIKLRQLFNKISDDSYKKSIEIEREMRIKRNQSLPLLRWEVSQEAKKKAKQTLIDIVRGEIIATFEAFKQDNIIPNFSFIVRYASIYQFPVQIVCYLGDQALFNKLLELEAYPFIADMYHHFANNALHAAANGGNIAICKQLMEMSENEIIINIKNTTPLHRAANIGNVNIVNYFVKTCRMKNSQNIIGETPLFYAKDRLALYKHKPESSEFDRLTKTIEYLQSVQG